MSQFLNDDDGTYQDADGNTWAAGTGPGEGMPSSPYAQGVPLDYSSAGDFSGDSFATDYSGLFGDPYAADYGGYSSFPGSYPPNTPTNVNPNTGTGASDPGVAPSSDPNVGVGIGPPAIGSAAFGYTPGNRTPAIDPNWRPQTGGKGGRTPPPSGPGSQFLPSPTAPLHKLLKR